MTRVLACDPGVASGWAIRDLDDTVRWGTEEQIEMCDLARAWAWVAAPGDVIVCEAYRITGSTTKMTFQPASLEIIGVLRWIAARNELKFILQVPAEKKFMPDDTLRQLGWWTPGSAGHDHDALRHLGVYMAKHERDERILRAR